MKINEKKNWDKEEIILALVKMRIEKFATTKTMLDFLMKDIGYKQTYSYELIKISKERINEIFKEEYEESFSNAIARLEEIIERTKNEKMRLEAQKEMNKLLGLYKPQRVDVTTNGENIGFSSIEVKIIDSKNDLDE
jgi:16S rRNA C1402 N4-methylase RsmH